MNDMMQRIKRTQIDHKSGYNSPASIAFEPEIAAGDTYAASPHVGGFESRFDACAWWLARYEGRDVGYWSGFDGPRAVHVMPRAGMGATYNCGSDRYAYTVIEVVSETCAKLQSDTRPNKVVEVSLRRDGRWRKVGDTMKGLTYTLGERDSYIDPHR